MNNDPGENSESEEHAVHRICQLFAYRCPVPWATLQTTGNPKERFCEKCQEKVHLCDSETELNQQAALGHCAAIPVRVRRAGRESWDVLAGIPCPPRCRLCTIPARDFSYANIQPGPWGCGVSANPNEHGAICFDSLEIENEAFGAFSGGWAHVECLLKWKYLDPFLAAWNSALEKRFINKRLFVSERGTLEYTDPSTWRLSEAEVARRKIEHAEHAVQEALAQARAEQWAKKSAERRAYLANECAKAKRKAIAMGIATEENAGRVLYEMSLEDFKRDFHEFDVTRAFFR